MSQMFIAKIKIPNKKRYLEWTTFIRKDGSPFTFNSAEDAINETSWIWPNTPVKAEKLT